MKKLFIGTNTKMTKTRQETVDFLSRLQDVTSDISRTELTLFVLPSYPTLFSARSAIKDHAILLGAQNICWAETGQYTGEISPRMLEEIGIDMVMVGHSERRHVFLEDDKMENLKVLTCLKHGFRTLLCVGETAEEKSYGIADEVLRKQILMGLRNMDPKDSHLLMIAYEPVWAIGVNGEPATASYAQEKHLVIKKVLRDVLGQRADDVPVLYGGSVNPDNAEDLINCDAIDGLYVGRSAWDADKFNALIRQVFPLWKKRSNGR